MKYKYVVLAILLWLIGSIAFGYLICTDSRVLAKVIISTYVLIRSYFYWCIVQLELYEIKNAS
jgi:hypothetical protein